MEHLFQVANPVTKMSLFLHHPFYFGATEKKGMEDETLISRKKTKTKQKTKNKNKTEFDVMLRTCLGDLSFVPVLNNQQRFVFITSDSLMGFPFKRKKMFVLVYSP